MSSRSLATFVTVVLLLAVVAPAAAVGERPQARSAHAGGAVAGADDLFNSSLAPGEVEMQVELAADGDARWRVATVLSVSNGDERAAFRDLVAEFNESESPLGLDAFRAGAASASRETGRAMEIRNVERHHALRNGTGALWVTFTWTEFGDRNGDLLAVDDGFNTSSDVWLPSLAASESLVVVPPQGYGVSSAPTGSSSAPSRISNGVARWEGPQDFGQRGPWIVYAGDAPVSTATPTPTTGPGGNQSTGEGPTTGTGGPPGGGNGDGLLSGSLPLVVVVLAGAGAVVLAAYARRDDGDGLGGLLSPDGPDGDDDADADAASTTEPTTDTEAGVGTTNGSAAATDSATGAGDPAGNAASSAGSAAGATVPSDDDRADADEGIDEALLSDEERVERLIERNGGRMKQAAIVRETGWSNAKVSQLLSAMDEDGRIDKLRIGRENLISFPDEDVADIDPE